MQRFSSITVYKIVIAALFSVFIAVSAQISIAIPINAFTVPITFQTLAVLLAGLILGPIWGSLSVGLYQLAGLIGLPIFSRGASGLAAYQGPTGGFIIGFLFMALGAGLISRALSSWDKGAKAYSRQALGAMVGTLVVYAIGLPWFKMVFDVPWTGDQSALAYALIPFIPGDLLKIFVASALSLPLSKLYHSQIARLGENAGEL